MKKKELYQQKKQAELDEWIAEVSKLKAEISGADADAKLALNEHIQALEDKIKDGRTRLAQVANATEDTWESIKERVESAWDSMTAAFSGVAAKFKK